MRNPFKKSVDFEFVDLRGHSYVNDLTSIKLATDIKPKWAEEQKEKSGAWIFPRCPGMYDLYKSGYIVPAWTDIFIKANKAGTVVITPDAKFIPPGKLDATFVDGIFQIQDEIKFQPYKVPSPWGCFSKPGISAMVLAPTFHSTHLDDLYIYPGIVDYDKFHTINLMFAAKRECEVHIKPGEPLLHVIPFTNQRISSSCGPASQYQMDKYNNQIISRVPKAYYRKFLQTMKKFVLNQKDDESNE